MINLWVKAPNAVSLFRIFFTLGHVVFYTAMSPWLNVVLVVFNYLLDGADGIVSRRIGGTDYGEFMDISVDRVVTLSYFVLHVAQGNFMLVIFLLVLTRNMMVDYVTYFSLIDGKKKERHKMTSGLHYWVYSSKASKIINGGLQMAISCWGFIGPIPLWLQIVFLLNSYIRGGPSFKKLWGVV